MKDLALVRFKPIIYNIRGHPRLSGEGIDVKQTPTDGEGLGVWESENV